MEEKKGFIDWVKRHKKELIIAGIGIGTLIAIILGIKNRDSLLEMWEALKTAINTNRSSVQKMIAKSQDTIPTPGMESLSSVQSTEDEKIIPDPFEVSRHVRNLPLGRNASAKKLAEAKELGIDLLPGQTLVNPYTKGNAVA